MKRLASIMVVAGCLAALAAPLDAAGVNVRITGGRWDLHWHSGYGHGHGHRPGHYYPGCWYPGRPTYGHRGPRVHPHPYGHYPRIPYRYVPCHYPYISSYPWGWGGLIYVSSTGTMVTGTGGWVVYVSGAPSDAPVRLDGVTPPPFAPGVENPKPKRAETASEIVMQSADLTELSRVYRLGNVARTESRFRAAIRKRPHDARLYYANAWLFAVDGRALPGALMLRRALTLDKGPGDAGRAALAGFYEAKAAQVALKKLEKHLVAAPDDAEARLLRAWVRLMHGSAEAAGRDLSVLLSVRKSDAGARRLLEHIGP